ncbi:MAG TPA: DUF72 domain-containing protein [Candidatus Polarisedimenticolia bacterium]|nr:DUF72 domain-containing protein [Candidatus Polarisedimenticolia bacterium]
MIRVGIAGWDYPDWAGIVYPSRPPRGFDRLAFLASFFDVIEINSTFYRQPDHRAASSWARRVKRNKEFRFTAKLYRGFTHGGRIPGLPSLPSTGTGLAAEAERYRSGLEPLLAAGLLQAVLMQFPQSFHDGTESRVRVESLARTFSGLPLVAEFRHRSWDNQEVLRLLRDLGIGFCNLDQPRLGSTLEPTEHLTAPLAYVRLHGRNADNWFTPRATAASRYDYFYSMAELEPWLERARRLAQSAREVVIIANNHYRGKGPANGLMLRAALLGERVKAPASLVETYPPLAARADRLPSEAAQGRLF